MKKILTRFFVTLGVIFFIIICVGAYIWFADPFEIRPLINTLTSGDGTVTVSDGVDKNPTLSESQETALEKIGIDPAILPTTITSEMEACFTEKLGAKRVLEIKNGDSPTATEVFTAHSCYE